MLGRRWGAMRACSNGQETVQRALQVADLGTQALSVSVTLVSSAVIQVVLTCMLPTEKARKDAMPLPWAEVIAIAHALISDGDPTTTNLESPIGNKAVRAGLQLNPCQQQPMVKCQFRNRF